MKNFGFDKLFFEKAFSEARMRPYFQRCNGHNRLAIQLYEQNISLAEALQPSLSIFEVTLRNAIIRELERAAGNKEWYTYILSLPKLGSICNSLSIAISHIQARGETLSADKINGELTMGFWVSLFNADYKRILWKDLRRAFPNIPKNKRKRRMISTPLNAIRILRNRVFHNEAIGWNLDRLSKYHSLIIEVIEWINPEVTEWMKRVDRFDKVIIMARIKRKLLYN